MRITDKHNKHIVVLSLLVFLFASLVYVIENIANPQDIRKFAVVNSISSNPTPIPVLTIGMGAVSPALRPISRLTCGDCTAMGRSSLCYMKAKGESFCTAHFRNTANVQCSVCTVPSGRPTITQQPAKRLGCLIQINNSFNTNLNFGVSLSGFVTGGRTTLDINDYSFSWKASFEQKKFGLFRLNTLLQTDHNVVWSANWSEVPPVLTTPTPPVRYVDFQLKVTDPYGNTASCQKLAPLPV